MVKNFVWHSGHCLAHLSDIVAVFALPDYCVVHVWYVQAYEGRVSCSSTSFTLDRLEDQCGPCWCVENVAVTSLPHCELV